MTIDEKRVNKMVNELESLKFFNQLYRLPRQFYDLNDAEKAETIKRYRQRNGIGRAKENGLE